MGTGLDLRVRQLGGAGSWRGGLGKQRREQEASSHPSYVLYLPCTRGLTVLEHPLPATVEHAQHGQHVELLAY